MIKLIATDIDGTLVKDGSLLIDPEYMSVIDRLIDKGIIFVVCSGRQSSSEFKLFAPIKHKLFVYNRRRNRRAHSKGNPKNLSYGRGYMEGHVPDGPR